MNVIIPLGGKGERFVKEGYKEPKPFIKVLDKEIIFHVIDNLNIKQEDRIFIIYNKDLDDFLFKDVLIQKYKELNIRLIRLDRDTLGAAETVSIGLKYIFEHYIFHQKTILLDGDTFYTEDILEKFRNVSYNAIFYTINTDPNPVFSYIKLDNNNRFICDIAEKVKISDNANTGAYAFSNIEVLYYYATYIVENNITFKNECYTSCIIAEMIKQHEHFVGVELKECDVHILGTPKQVNEFIALSLQICPPIIQNKNF
jgi:dTDP-glucose pyrophosphorylase